MIERITVQLTVLQGSDLVAKDRNLFGKKTTSDPYVEVFVENRKRLGRTLTQSKTLNPVWKNRNVFHVEFQNVTVTPYVTLKVWDEDLLSEPDLMGVVNIAVPLDGAQNDTATTKTAWYEIPPSSARNAKGRLQVRIQTTVHSPRALMRGNVWDLTGGAATSTARTAATNAVNHSRIQVGLAWDMLPGGKEVDLDVSCVSITHDGQVSMPDTIYYGNTRNSNGSMVHSGDEREGDEHGDDETISIDLDRIPSSVLAMYVLLTVATPNMRIPDIKSTTLRVYGHDQYHPRNSFTLTLCTFTPARHALSRDSTAMFMCRIARTAPFSQEWNMSPIEDTHPTARDFGSLLPYMKSYTRDLLPSIHVDPTERVAIMRKGGNVRLTDYCHNGRLPDRVTFGLAWDVTNGVNIDLDASAICLDQGLNLVDQVWWRQLQSQDRSIRHHGDEREGDEIGDDEKMDIYLNQVSEFVHYIGFVINSFSGQELDDVARASCHLFDPQTNVDMASYALTDSHSLDKHTALVVACLYRGGSPGEWNLCIISEPAQGKLVKDNVDELQNYLRRYPPQPPTSHLGDDEEIVVEAKMPSFRPLVEDEEIDLSLPPPNNEQEIDLSVPIR